MNIYPPKINNAFVSVVILITIVACGGGNDKLSDRFSDEVRT